MSHDDVIFDDLTRQESILDIINYCVSNFVKPDSEDILNDFEDHCETCYGPHIFHGLIICRFWDQSDNSIIDCCIHVVIFKKNQALLQ